MTLRSSAIASDRFASPTRVNIILFFMFAAILLAVGIGMRSPWPADEPRFAQIAREMVESGQWLFPLRGGEYYPDKPPVFMWSIAVFYLITGSLKLAFLLPSALCALLTLFLIYDLGRRLWDTRTGLLAAAALLFSFQFVLQGKSAQIDAMVTCWITMGCYGLLRFMLIERRWRWYYLACFFMGIGIITKGVGFLPIFMLLPFALQRFYSTRHNVPFVFADTGRWLAGPVVMLLAVCLWLLPMLWVVQNSNDPLLLQYRDNILFHQTVTRYADSWHHIKPFWYYLVNVIPLFWLPLSLVIPWLVPHWLKQCRQGDARILIPLTWIVLVLVFFSVSPGKRGVYVLPALPMLALISAPFLPDLASRKGLTWLLWSVVMLISASLLIAGIAGLAEVKAVVKLQDKFDITPWLFFCALGGMGLLLGAGLYNRRQWLAWPGFITLLWFGYSSWGALLLEHVKTPKHIYRNILAVHGDNIDIALVDFSEQFLLFSPYPVTHFGFHTPNDIQLSQAYDWLAEDRHRFVLTHYDVLTNTCFNRDLVEHVGFAHRADWVLIPATARLASCPTPANGSVAPVYHYVPKTVFSDS